MCKGALTMTPLEAYNALQRGFGKLSSEKAKLGDIRHPDTLSAILDALAPAVVGGGRTAMPQPRQQKSAGQVEHDNRRAATEPVCNKCGSIPCECDWQKDMST